MSFRATRSVSLALVNTSPIYSKGAYSSLPTLPNNYATPFSSTDYTNVYDWNDSLTVDQTSDAVNTISAFLFKVPQPNGSVYDGTSINAWKDYAIEVTWFGQSTVAGSTATITVEIYNFTTGAWVSIGTDAVIAANTATFIYGSVDDPGYFNPTNRDVVIRAYQTTNTGTLSTDAIEVNFISNTAVTGSVLSGYTLIKRMSNTNDDGDEKNHTSMSIASANNRLGNYGGNFFDTGLRFRSVTIASGSSITAAVLNIYVTLAPPVSTTYTIKGILQANPVDLVTTRPSLQPKTIASSSITLSNTTSGYNVSADMTSIVQEIINQAGWASGNSVEFVLLNNTDPFNFYTKISDFSSSLSARYAEFGVSYTAGGGGGSSHASTRMMMGMGM